MTFALIAGLLMILWGGYFVVEYACMFIEDRNA